MKAKRLIGILSIIGAILLIPLIAMQFTKEVDWQLFDFIIAAILLTGAGLLIDLAIRKIKDSKNRVLITVLVILILVLVWAELGVGIFGTPFAGS